MTVGIEELESTKCKYCKAVLQTDLEKKKEIHWDCLSDFMKAEYQRIKKEDFDFVEPLCKYCSNVLLEETELFRKAHWNCHELVSFHKYADTTGNDVLTINKPYKAIQSALDHIIQEAENKFGYSYIGTQPTYGLGLGILRPSHFENSINKTPNYYKKFGFSNSWFAKTEKEYWTRWIDTKINENMYLLLTGIFNLSSNPSITELYLQVDGIDQPIINIESMYAQLYPSLWFKQPYILKPENPFKCSVYSTKTRERENIGFTGYIVGKRWSLIEQS